MRVGVLALQGDVSEHIDLLRQLGAESFEVRSAQQVATLDGLILPGGESTTIAQLMRYYGIETAIQEAYARGLALYGTCAGLILLAKRIEGRKDGSLALLDVTAVRNGFGRQINSFEADLSIPVLGEPPFRAVFIRAPYVRDPGPDVEILARYEERIVAVRSDRLLASAFHPELSGDPRMHAYFLQMIAAKQPTAV
ncbi:MAG: pyridoxal 5'-phosphate synthase glutaminase subunit PdxT [Firmicutes bacterium]|nr:pyridoxal 5'-phosphate synthase glutaminase subunit PdxT [Bacillota bacterium]